MAIRGLSLPPGRRLVHHRLLCRAFSTHPRHIAVPCASDDPITISLYHERQHPRWTPLLLYLPPSGAVDSAPLPDFLRRQKLCPVASVPYRWAWPPDRTYETLQTEYDDTLNKLSDMRPSRLWPAPLHDVLFGYDWLRKNLRRPILVYGEHLGAGLAASLALTESFSYKRTSVRGLAAYNGIYDWSVFIDRWSRVQTYNRQKNIKMNAATLSSIDPAPFALPLLDELFVRPPDLLDPFASPDLFFLSIGPVLLPDAFHPQDVPNVRPVVPFESVKSHRIHLDYPHRDTLLDIPAALLLHDAADETDFDPDIPTNKSYASQAAELGELMRRGIRRIAWEENLDLNDGPSTEEVEAAARAAELHVRVLGVDPSDDGLDRRGQDALLAWIEEQILHCAKQRAEAIGQTDDAEGYSLG
ncbi:hypothetical protein CMQ_6436 [Grosmannia clavigera kw1407]|uniref:Alpha/beta hydrolase fold-3 domain-containing protein n=1 Tax=Grosmannia clavigera (strain kw1407 / UAMH 11150) TaxID=655863 RepID=F0XMV0_GROCL|nr:uncharacterized protein CMQ_6436 [Grosmannia clavigera kw1407]EFX01494.1 hypothetical protein CMQ_6436 [Grosmannia clavigera kw1407]